MKSNLLQWKNRSFPKHLHIQDQVLAKLSNFRLLIHCKTPVSVVHLGFYGVAHTLKNKTVKLTGQWWEETSHWRRSVHTKASGKLQIFPSRFQKTQHYKQPWLFHSCCCVQVLSSLTVSAPACVCVCVYRVWGRGGNFLSKLETEWVTEFSLSMLQSARSRKSCHTIPLSDGKK